MKNYAVKVSIPLEQGSVLRPLSKKQIEIESRSQSLWNRAVSYDYFLHVIKMKSFVSIPLEQGSVLRHLKGNASRLAEICLNPFGTGQCLTTVTLESLNLQARVSIPLEQGSVLRPQWGHQALCDKAYRSHFPTFSETQRVGS